MSRISSIKRQSREIQREINALLDAGRTLDEILAVLRDMGAHDVSRSALGRYKKQYDEVIAAVRQSREVSEALVKEFGRGEEPKAMRANIEIMQSIITRMILPMTGGGSVDLKDIATLAKAIDSLGRAGKLDADMLARAREEARREAQEQFRRRVEELKPADLKEMTDAELAQRLAELTSA